MSHLHIFATCLEEIVLFRERRQKSTHLNPTKCGISAASSAEDTEPATDTAALKRHSVRRQAPLMDTRPGGGNP